MTLHVAYNHQCEACEAFYIPYDADVPCPACGRVEAERFDFIPEAVSSFLFNKQSYGSYSPPAWWVGSLGDHILHILFTVFDDYDEAGAEGEFGAFSAERLSRMDWGVQQYMRDHVHSIAVRIRCELDRA